MSNPENKSSPLSHIDAAGKANMVDISDKDDTQRVAVAMARVRMQPETLKAITDNTAAKGDVLAVARVAGIQAAKRCPDLIPLCHPLKLSKVGIDFSVAGEGALVVRAEVKVSGQTGVEMEALTAASIAALTIYDMCKAMDRAMVIEETCVLSKAGGKSGDWERPDS